MKYVIVLAGLMLCFSLHGVERSPDLHKQLAELQRAQELLAEQVAALQLEAGDPKVRDTSYAFDVAVMSSVVVGGSSVADDELAPLQAGGHDPKIRGFNIPYVELDLSGSVDQYVSAKVRIVTFISAEGETELELEEAFIRTSYLPFSGFLLAGQFLSPFGITNSIHPHAWTWLDQPIINSRLFGADGMRGQGLQAAVDFEHGWKSQALFTVQNARGETMVSFNNEAGETFSGYPLQTQETHNYSDFVNIIGWHHDVESTGQFQMRFGLDAAYGPNAMGANTTTTMYGGHIAMRWGASRHDHAGVVSCLLEVAKRSYRVDAYTDDPDETPGSGDETIYPADALSDWGLTNEWSVGFHADWLIGVRFELAHGHGESVGGRNNDPLRDDRWRVSPLITWNPSEATRVRLQYNCDQAAHVSDTLVHTVWLGVDVILGRHPSHDF